MLRCRRDAEAIELLRGLLRDPLDTAPVQAAAEMLVQQGDDTAWDLLFEAIADEPVEDEHLLLFIGYGSSAYMHRLIEAASERSTESMNPQTRRGALEFLEWLGATS